MTTLECVEGPSKGLVFELARDGACAVLGRSPDCDIAVEDQTCSRRHASVFARGGEFFVTDLGSTNGIRLNGKHVEEGLLSHGDRFSFGKSAFRFVNVERNHTAASGCDLDGMIENTITLTDAESSLFRVARRSDDVESISDKELSALRRASRQMEAVYSLNRALEGTFSLAELYGIVSTSIFSQFDAVERVCIFVSDRRTEHFQQVASQCNCDIVELPVSRDVLERVRCTSAALLATDVQGDERFVESETLFDCSVRSFMCVPLNTRDRTVGAVYVENRTRPGCFETSDLELLTVFGNQIATALENTSLYEELERSFYETIRSLLAALEAKDEYTRGHSDRVALYAVGVGETLELPKDQLNNLKAAAELHDIGKIAIPESIINSPSRLSDAEFECIKKHPDYGVEILRPIRFLSSVLPIVRHHHERYDGTGYPEGWKGDAIPIEARILNLADAFDAMTSSRSYNEPATFPDALRRCQSEAGESFDPDCVAALCTFVEKRFGVQPAGPTSTQDAPVPEGSSRDKTGAFDQEAVTRAISERASLTP